MNKRIVSFKIITTPRNGKNIATLIYDKIMDLGICDKMFTITLDSASNNDVVQNIKKILRNKRRSY